MIRVCDGAANLEVPVGEHVNNRQKDIPVMLIVPYYH